MRFMKWRLGQASKKYQVFTESPGVCKVVGFKNISSTPQQDQTSDMRVPPIPETMVPSVPHESVSPVSSKSRYAGPFRATQLWNDIVCHLKQTVEVKRRRVKMKTYCSCFTGAHAVDVILHRLVYEKANLANKDISRDKAIKLCQLLMENDVFEPVKATHHHHPDDAKNRFEDSSTKFYRFVEDATKENKYTTEQVKFACTPCTKMRINPDLGMDDEEEDEENVISNPAAQGQFMQEFLNITGTWKRYSTDCLVGSGKSQPKRLFLRRPSLPDCSNDSRSLPDFSIHHIPPAVEEEVWREVALSQLLMLVDIPVLDTILSYDATEEKSGKQQSSAAFSNLAFKRWESITSLFSDKSEDAWQDAAMDCLECHPQGLDILDGSLSEESEAAHKLKLFQALSDHYGSLHIPLWSPKFIELHIALLNLLMQGRDQIVLRAIQLGLMLLPVMVREEIRRLLVFMHVASQDDSILINPTESNASAVQRIFSQAIIRNKMMAPQQSAQLVAFMSLNHESLLTTPDDVADVAMVKLRHLSRTQVQAPIPVPSYCTRVSEDEFRKQQSEGTEAALVDLINKILDDTHIPLKEKKHRLKQLQKHHPEIYTKYFSDML